MAVYIAKPQTWFKEDSIVELLEYLTIDTEGNKYGLFRGIHIVSIKDMSWLADYDIGEEVMTNEVCSYNEFEKREV
jgi:hypothetical protein